ncbi:MAG TPA: hypothetical protein VGP57_04350, partial [Actinoplanes sp.]|nr:hypothetical protein [Actinoplanes sp.]
PTLDPEVVRSLLARTPGYSLPAEREAETIADLLWRRTKPWAAEPTWKVSASAADVIARIRHSLTGE